MRRCVLALFASILTACTGTPEGVDVVGEFELETYLGTWYEIARLDHRFERGLSNVTANYTLRDDGGVAVLNRGYREKKGEWDEASGKAYFVDDTTVGKLKVSFFGPFYGGYNVVALDPERYSMVVGPNLSYLWILSRQPELDAATLDTLIRQADSYGIDTNELIFVEHDRAD